MLFVYKRPTHLLSNKISAIAGKCKKSLNDDQSLALSKILGSYAT